MNSLSVVIATHNNVHSLSLTLEGFARQTDPDFVVHVVNDGGDEAVEEVVSEFFARMNVFYHYLYPKSTEFRASAARNLGMRHCNTMRVLVSDEDCVPASNVIEIHKTYGEQCLIVCSNRSYIMHEEVAQLRSIEDIASFAHAPRVAVSCYGDHRNQEVYFFDKYDPLIGRVHYAFEDAWSSSVSYPCTLVKSIGGFWEKFSEWGGEDAELAKRLTRLGCRVLLRPDASVYHLNHPSRQKPGWEMRCSELFRESDRMETPLRNQGPL